MPTPRIINSLLHLGLRPEFETWENNVSRKINITSLFAGFNILVGLFVFWFFDYYGANLIILLGLIGLCVILFINYKFGYLPAAYAYSLIGSTFIFFTVAKLGPETYSIIFYFPLIGSVVQLVNRREQTIHRLLFVGICLSAVGLTIFSQSHNYFISDIPLNYIQTLKNANILLGCFVFGVLIMQIAVESSNQERQLEKSINQKEILLAELFHRVRNNLTIVNSLLNLKKNSIDSPVFKQAIEECRNMVYSMSLVHTKVYNNTRIEKLYFKEYILEIIQEVLKSLGSSALIRCEQVNESSIIKVSQAISFGLIINELVTNSFKHGSVLGKELALTISLIEENGNTYFNYQDNGPGLQSLEKIKESVGIDLIYSLVNQIDGKCEFINKKGGFEFKLVIPKGNT